MTAIQNVCERNYSQAKFQCFLAHINRNVMGNVRISYRQEVTSDFKKIYHISTTQEGKEKI